MMRYVCRHNHHIFVSIYHILMSLLHFIFFFLYNVNAPTEIYTLPTRRSSDLSNVSTEIMMNPDLGGLADLVVHMPLCAIGRSEEHTSELQSHHDLVCRLLLEKKNYKNLYN